MTERTIQIGGRRYQVETVLGARDQDRKIYRLTSVRKKVYVTVRNRTNPNLMFLILEGTPDSGILEGIWLSDESGTLQLAEVVFLGRKTS